MLISSPANLDWSTDTGVLHYSWPPLPRFIAGLRMMENLFAITYSFYLFQNINQLKYRLSFQKTIKVILFPYKYLQPAPRTT